jgi:uncharacterized protein (DUF2062 family)
MGPPTHEAAQKVCGEAAAAPFHPVVVAPTHNNADTLLDILERVEAQRLPLVVVDDGSRDSTAARLAAWRRGPRRVAVEAITHETNRGKAAALRAGFARARALGYSHAVTLDTDGQLDPEDIPPMLAAARHDPGALILGVRDALQHDGPGRRLSNFGVRLACGARLEDSQCGLRVYPLSLVEALGCRGERYAWETEILVRAAWAGAGLVEVPVHSRYFPPEKRVSSFRPISDSLRGLALHLRLLGRRLLPWGSPGVPSACAREAQAPWRRRFLEWVSPRALWHELRAGPAGRASFAAALSLGTFIANLPIYGLQTLLSLYVAKRLHLHPLPLVAGSHLSTPPIGPSLVFAAIGIGHLLLNGGWPGELPPLEGPMHVLRLSGHLLGAWLIGSVIVGFVCMIVTFFGCLAVLRLWPGRARAALRGHEAAAHERAHA